VDATYKIKTIALVLFMAVSEVLSTTSVALSKGSEQFLTTTPVFAGILWGTDAVSVQSQMIAKGYKFGASGIVVGGVEDSEPGDQYGRAWDAASTAELLRLQPS
jgi:hypothetical protein